MTQVAMLCRIVSSRTFELVNTGSSRPMRYETSRSQKTRHARPLPRRHRAYLAGITGRTMCDGWSLSW